MFVPAQLVQPNQTAYFYYAYDYAVVALANRPTLVPAPPAGCPANPPSMLKQALSDGVLLNNDFRHDGYPACNAPGAPSGCVANSHYEVLPCDTGDDPATVIQENGVDTTIATDAVTSDGHSGGPYWYFNTGGQPTVIGTHVGGPDGGGSGLSSVFRRFTAVSLNQINTWVCMAVPCM